MISNDNKENLTSTVISIERKNHNHCANMTSKTDIPTLFCAKFQESLCLEFKSVDVGSTNTKQFRLYNPSINRKISIGIDKVPEKKGFVIKLGNNCLDDCVEIEPKKSALATVFWLPNCDMQIREAIILKLNKNASLKIILLGSAGLGNTQVHFLNIKC
jgi:hypothetical protein